MHRSIRHPIALTLQLAIASTCLCGASSAQGSALRFDGVDDYVEFGGGDARQDPADFSFTVEAWIRMPNGSADGAAVSTSYQPYCSDRGYSLWASGQAGNWTAGAGVARIGCGNDGGSFATVVDLGGWHHLAATYQVTATAGSTAIGTLSVFVDGGLVASTPGLYMDTETNPSLKFGASSGRNHDPLPNYWQGEIDEVRIWNCARSPHAILSTMNTSLIGNESHLVGYWPLDEGQGQTVNNLGNPAAWSSFPFGWQGRLGNSSSVDPSDPEFVPSTAPITASGGAPATQTVRLGTPPNPNVLTSPAAPRIASDWTLSVDHTSFVPNATADFLIFCPARANTTVAPLVGTLLCDVSNPGTVTISIPVGAPFGLAVPDDCALVGFAGTVQGASLSAAPIAAHLTNALDFQLGH